MTLRKKQRNTKKVFFLNKLKKGYILGKIWICLNNFFDQTRIMGEISTKTFFSPQSEPHSAEIRFSVVSKQFWVIHRELLFLVKKVTTSERSTEILRKFIFHNMFEKGKIMRKIWIRLNNCF